MWALFSGLTLRALGTLNALHTLWALWPLQGSDADPILVGLRPDIDLAIGTDLIGTICSVGKCRSQCRQRGVYVADLKRAAVITLVALGALNPLRPLCPCRPLNALLARRTLNPLRALHSCLAFFTFRACRARRACLALFAARPLWPHHTGWPLPALQALRALRALWAAYSLRPLIALESLQALHALSTLCALYTLWPLRAAHVDGRRNRAAGAYPEAHQTCILIHLRDDRIACVALLPLNSLRALGAGSSRIAFLTLHAVYDGIGLVIRHFAVVKFQSAALRQQTSVHAVDQMTGGGNLLPAHAIR